MRKIKDVLRLKFEAGLSHERTAIAVGVSKGAVNKYLKRAAQAGIVWPLDALLDESALAGLLFAKTATPAPGYALPDFAHIHQELKRKGVTLTLLSRSRFGTNQNPRIRKRRFVVWESTSNLTGGNPGSDWVVYLFDRKKD